MKLYEVLFAKNTGDSAPIQLKAYGVGKSEEDAIAFVKERKCPDISDGENLYSGFSASIVPDPEDVTEWRLYKMMYCGSAYIGYSAGRNLEEAYRYMEAYTGIAPMLGNCTGTVVHYLSNPNNYRGVTARHWKFSGENFVVSVVDKRSERIKKPYGVHIYESFGRAYLQVDSLDFEPDEFCVIDYVVDGKTEYSWFIDNAHFMMTN